MPVISPLPFSEYQPAKTGASSLSPRGKTAVTPVRTGPTPTFNLPWPEISVVWPTVTPATSVIAFSGPGVPSKGIPRSRARGGGAAATATDTTAGNTQPNQTVLLFMWAIVPDSSPARTAKPDFDRSGLSRGAKARKATANPGNELRRSQGG